MNRLLRRTAVSASLAVAAVAIAVPLTTGGSASAAPTTLSPVAAMAGLTDPAGAHAPQALKDDLKAAWAAPDGQRVAALQAVLDKAVGGAYGEKVAARAAKVRARMAALPAALRTDVNAAIELPQDQRRAALKEIRAKVRAGDYGDVKRPLRPFRFLHQR
jgi:hypothetical protein